MSENDILRSFEFSTKNITEESYAIEACEKFCSSDDQCWGCSKSCLTSCQWNALSDCKNYESPDIYDQPYITQKPGIKKYNLNKI